MKVPLLDLSEQNGALKEELAEVFERVLESGRFILGEEVEAFESEVAEAVGAKFAVGASSGTDALLLSLMALDIGPGDEVICPAFTFFATAGCVSRLGATPVFVDSCPVCLNLDVAGVEASVTERTRAIIPVHLFGQAAAMDPIMALGEKHGLPVIEDAAQSQGARYQGREAGAMGEAGIFSFFPTKNLGAFGDAGMLVTSNADIAGRARTLRNHGMQPKYHHAVVGGNFRLDALQAAILRVKFRHLASYTDGRRHNAEFYSKGLSALPGVAAEEGKACGGNVDTSLRLLLPSIHPGNDSTWNQYTLRIRGEGKRDALRKHLDDRGIGSEIYYPVPLHRQECLRKFVPENLALPCCEAACEEVLSLPIFPELSDEAKEVVIEAIGEFLQKG